MKEPVGEAGGSGVVGSRGTHQGHAPGNSEGEFLISLS